MAQITVLIPCLNEENTISDVVRSFKEALPGCTVYVYDNNSSDETVKRAAESGAVVRHEKARGKGNVVRRMFREIEADCYILADGDGTYPADAAPKMARMILDGEADMVCGDRLSSTYFEENKRPFHNFGNRLVRGMVNTLFGCDVKDVMTGYRAFSRCFVKTFPVLSTGFELETEMTVHAAEKRMAVAELPVHYQDRKEGSHSKLHTIPDGFRVLKLCVHLFCCYRPLAFFNIFAMILLIIAAAFFFPVLLEYLNTGIVRRFPTLIVCGFTVLAAIQAFFSGLILHTLRRKERAEFEMRLIENYSQPGKSDR